TGMMEGEQTALPPSSTPTDAGASRPPASSPPVEAGREDVRTPMTDTTESRPSTDDRIEAPPPPPGGYPSNAEVRASSRGIDVEPSSGPPSNPGLRLAGLLAALVALGLWRPWMLV